MKKILYMSILTIGAGLKGLDHKNFPETVKIKTSNGTVDATIEGYGDLQTIVDYIDDFYNANDPLIDFQKTPVTAASLTAILKADMAIAGKLKTTNIDTVKKQYDALSNKALLNAKVSNSLAPAELTNIQTLVKYANDADFLGSTVALRGIVNTIYGQISEQALVLAIKSTKTSQSSLAVQTWLENINKIVDKLNNDLKISLLSLFQSGLSVQFAKAEVNKLSLKQAIFVDLLSEYLSPNSLYLFDTTVELIKTFKDLSKTLQKELLKHINQDSLSAKNKITA